MLLIYLFTNDINLQRCHHSCCPIISLPISHRYMWWHLLQNKILLLKYDIHKVHPALEWHLKHIYNSLNIFQISLSVHFNFTHFSVLMEGPFQLHTFFHSHMGPFFHSHGGPISTLNAFFSPHGRFISTSFIFPFSWRVHFNFMHFSVFMESSFSTSCIFPLFSSFSGRGGAF